MTSVAMVRAQVMTLRRQRSVTAIALMLTVGVTLLYFGYEEIRHLGNAQAYGPAGGMNGFTNLLRDIVLFFGALTGLLVGSQAGTADVTSGVFRDLVTTGRTRSSLFSARVIAAVLTTFACTAAAYAIGIVAVFALPGSTPLPMAEQVAGGFGWVLLVSVLFSVLGTGAGAAIGNRAAALTLTVGYELILSRLILRIGSLGGVHPLLLDSALGRIGPAAVDNGVGMGFVTAVLVLGVWALLPIAVGTWVTVRRDA